MTLALSPARALCAGLLSLSGCIFAPFFGGPECGDGLIQKGETCDFGAQPDINQCSARCQVFTPPDQTLATGKDPIALLLLDLNNDQALDIIVANKDDRNLSLFLNNGNGTFADATNVSTIDEPTQLAAGNFDGDGLPDLVISTRGDNSFFSSTEGNTGQNLITLSPILLNNLGQEALSVAVGRINDDLLDDIVLSTNEGNLLVFLQKIEGGDFDGPFNTFLFLNRDLRSVLVTELDGDSEPEILTAGLEEDINTSNQQEKLHIVPVDEFGNVFPGGQGLISFDIDADPRDRFVQDNFLPDSPGLETAIATKAGDSVTFLSQNGAAFAIDTLQGVNNAQSVASGDFNGDGLVDLLVGRDADNDSLFLFFGQGKQDKFEDEFLLQPFSANQQTEVVVAQDLNGDARTDIVALDNTNEQVTIFFGKP